MDEFKSIFNNYGITKRLWDQLCSEIIEGSATYFYETTRTCALVILLHILICFLFYYFQDNFSHKVVNNELVKNSRRILLVIAHPDDECMFFGPVILTLTKKRDCQLFLLCLSNGNFRKLGSKRKQELWDSCKTLGIPDSHITLCNNPFMQDDPTVVWKKDEVAQVILEQVESLDIDTVLTFDEDGVSGHYNHISIFNAMSYMLTKNILPNDCKVFTLQSINILRKYSFYMDLLMTHITSNIICKVKNDELYTIKKAMEQHKTQYVWFRKIYIRFSRYSFINSFREIDSSCFDFDIDDNGL
ncbi:N-acetylglucosaminyl-phosphatidylinositol de-N-acetylase [Nilaparvata lugens]|uniref:N-acetylglucosaminyl-phosphatidylinositol de-N-acetylase n=1 Tax=Nilaparvata lugens TaxID=108931 RepID=UPI00193D71A9|nr:N-acetylglucosaminyl-phosphatidylinositol de-N-acetylase [Nilaparvata lugens]